MTNIMDTLKLKWIDGHYMTNIIDTLKLKWTDGHCMTNIMDTSHDFKAYKHYLLYNIPSF